METTTKLGKRRAVLLPGCKYRNRNGIEYTCICRDGNDYIMKSQKGWMCPVHHVWLYDDGTIDWDFSSAGWWEERT